MAFELPIDFDPDPIERAFDRIIGKVDKLDEKVKGLNGDLRQSRTVSGRVVALPANPADGRAMSDPGALDRSPFPGERGFVGPIPGGRLRAAFPGEAGFVGPLPGPTARAPFAGERDFVGPLPGPRLRAASPGEADFIGPPRGPKFRAPFAGENDFIGPLPGLPDTKERVTRAGRSQTTDPWSYEGPRQRALRDAAMLDRARGTGDAALIGDWADRAKRSQAQVDKLDGKVGLGSMINNALMRSRINLGPLSPLAMDLAPLLGEAGGAALGGVGAALGIIQAGYANKRRNADAFYALGGSTTNIGRAIAYGGDGAEEKAMQLADRLREGTVGAGYLRSQGIQYRGRLTDYSGNYVAAIDALSRVQDVQERVRIAREVGLGEDAWIADLPEAEKKRLLNSRGEAGTDKERKDSAVARSRRERAMNYLGRAASFAGDVLFEATAGMGMRFMDAIDSVFGGDDKSKPKAKGAKVAPQGWDRSAVRPLAEGPETINGTTAGAISAGWRGKLLSDVLDNQGIMVGGFTI